MNALLSTMQLGLQYTTPTQKIKASFFLLTPLVSLNMSKSSSTHQQLSSSSLALLSALLVLGVLSSLVAEASANVPQGESKF